MYNHISLTRINNGYTVSAPTLPTYSTVGSPIKKEDSGKNFIPTQKNVFYFETLDKVFEFIKSIESNIPLDEFGCCAPYATPVIG